MRLAVHFITVFRMLLSNLHSLFFGKKKTAVVRLLPKGASQGTVVLSYLTWPFIDGWDSPKARGHTNAFEVVAIAETYQEFGYTVEIIDHDNEDYVPPRDCRIAIDLHGQLERWSPFLPKGCLRILHATGAHWLLANQSELSRLASIRDRKGVVLDPRRQSAPSRSVALADHIVVVGNEYTMKSFAFAGKPITRVPISSAYEFLLTEKKDFACAKKKFLWIGSYGMAHKGLDLVLDAFAQMPELSLTVCGRPEKEDDFFSLYEKELLQTPNIVFQGWVDMTSAEFMEIAKNHAAIIYPSSSEGGGGAVIHCMHAGMVPLCTEEASIDLNDFGMLISQGTVEAVMQVARSFSVLSEEEVARRSASSVAHVRRHHTRECFQKNYRHFVKDLLG